MKYAFDDLAERCRWQVEMESACGSVAKEEGWNARVARTSQLPQVLIAGIRRHSLRAYIWIAEHRLHLIT